MSLVKYRDFPIRNKGFTLLEVLIAITITAMIGLGSWLSLSRALVISEATDKRLTELNSLRKAMLMLERDIKQLIPRSTRNEYGDYGYAIDTKTEFYLLEFTRTGWRNPLGDKRSDLQRVAYELEDDALIRYHWYVLDRAQDSEAFSRTLMKGVEGFSVKFMTEKGSWVSSWPQDDSSSSGDEEDNDPRQKNSALPRALKFELESTRFGKLTRLFEISQHLTGQDYKVENEDDDNGGNTGASNSTSGTGSETTGNG